MKAKTADLIIQIISVTLGVFLGVVISNWSENQKENEKRDLLIQNVISEIESNKQKINRVIDYHRIVRDSSRHFLQQKALTQLKPTFFRGVNPLTFTNSAYETGIQTGLFNNMPLEKTQAINEVYTQQRAYEDFTNLMLAGLVNLDFTENEEAVRKIASYLAISMTDIVFKEELLLDSMESTLDKLDSQTR